jgi:8-oxo-dGTP pyrophosphatase MutT (NUDIX family)
MPKALDLQTVRTRLTRLPADAGPRTPGERRAAVAALLREVDAAHGTEILFIRRAEHPLDPWSGHMAFPGGRHDEGDADLLATVVRETFEEIGLDLRAHGALLGRLPELPAVARGQRVDMVITPYVFALGRADAALRPNPAEVAEVVWAPLAPLLRGEGAARYAYVHEGRELQLPSVRVGEHVVWGLTHAMLQQLFAALRAE